MTSNIFDRKILDIYIEAKALIIGAIPEVLAGASIKTVITPILDELQNQFQKWSSIRLPQEYIRGTNSFDQNDIDEFMNIENAEILMKANAEILGKMGGKHISAVKSIVNEANGFNKKAVDSQATVLKLALIKGHDEKVANLLALGNQNYDKKQSLVKYFNAQGITMFIDKRGVKREVERYAETIVRTETGKANNQGVINRSIEGGADGLQRLESSPCPICAPHNNEIRLFKDKGNNPPLLYHPNCRGVWTPYFL